MVAINSNELNPKDFASCPENANQPVEIPECELSLNMAVEQDKDEEIFSLKTVLKQGRPSKAMKASYLVENYIIYYLSDPHDNPTLRLFMPEHLRQIIVK